MRALASTFRAKVFPKVALAFAVVYLATLAMGASSGDARSPATSAAQAAPRPEPRTEVLATRLDGPWDMAFLPDGSALVTERVGRVRLLRRGTLLPRAVARVPVSSRTDGGGLLGVAVDPSFRRNRFVYLYRTTRRGNVVTRYRYVRGRLVQPLTIIRGIRAATGAGFGHDGGRLRFGPDRRLYVATGDAGVAALAQSARSLSGKYLRLGPSAYRSRGGRPEIFARGFRNPQGFAWQPGTMRLVGVDHGDVGGDEIDVLRRGANYGWPLVRGTEARPDYVPPILSYTPAIAPSGITFVTRPGSAWTGDLLVATLRGRHLRRVRLAGLRPVLEEELFAGQFGRLRSVVEGPDGAIYLLTSNSGSTRGPVDDRLIRVLPPGT